MFPMGISSPLKTSSLPTLICILYRSESAQYLISLFLKGLKRYLVIIRFVVAVGLVRSLVVDTDSRNTSV